MLNLKITKLPNKISYMLAIAGTLLIFFVGVGRSVEEYHYFIAKIVAAYLAFTIVLIAFNLSVQHRNRLTPYLGLAFLCVGIIDLFSALFAKGIIASPADSVESFTHVSHFLAQTMLSTILAIGWIRAVKRAGIWKVAPYYTIGVIVISITTMLALSKLSFHGVIHNSSSMFSVTFTFIPLLGNVITIVLIFKYKTWPNSQREFATGNALLPSLLVLILSQMSFPLSSVIGAEPVLLSYHLKILAYLLALITMVFTLWRYAEYSFQISGTKVSTIFCMMLFVLSFLSLLEFDRHEQELRSSNDQVLAELLKDQHLLNNIEFDLLNYQPTKDGNYLYKLGSIWPLHKELTNLLDNTAHPGEMKLLNNQFNDLQTSVKQLLDYPQSHSIITKSEITERLLPVIQKLQNLLVNIVNEHHDELVDNQHQKITSIHNQLLTQLGLIFLLIFFIIAVSRWNNSKILQPVINLNDIAKRVANNREKIHCVSGRNDELGMLEKSFNKLVDHLQSSLNDLEKRVTQRTEELSKNKQQLQNIMDHVEEGIITANQFGIIESVNLAVCNMFGYTELEMIGSPIYKLMGEGEREAHISTISKYSDLDYSEPLRSHRRYETGMRCDGSTFPIRISVTEIVKENKRTFIAVLSDVTKEIIAEKSLKESEQRMSRFFGASIEGLVFHEHGRIIDSNTAALDLFGYNDSDKLAGKNISDFIEPDQHDILQKSLDTDYSNSWESVIVRPNGERVPVKILIRDIDFNDQTLSIAVFRDITESKKAETKLQQARDKLRASLNLLNNIIESIPIRIFWKDRYFRYLGSNTLFANDIGLDNPDKLIGRTDKELLWENMAERTNSEDRHVLDTGNSILNIEESRSTQDGHMIWLRTSKVPLTNDEGVIIGVLGISDDITQQKQAEQTLQISERRLKEAQEIAHLGSWELDLVNDVLWWSDENYRIFGVDKNTNNTYESFLETVHPEDREFVNKTYTESIKYRTPYEIEHRLLMIDGTVKWVHEHCKTDYDDEGTALRSIGTTMDITQRKQAQHALEKYNQFTSKILYIIGSLVFVLDSEGRIVRFNRACEQLTGHLFEKIKGHYIWDLVPQINTQDNLKNLYRKPLKENFPNRLRFDWPTTHGDIRTIDLENLAFIDDDDELEYVIAAGVDITDRLVIENILKDQLSKLEQSVETRTRELDTMFTLSPDGFVMIDNMYQVIFANPAFLEMTGMSLNHVVGKSMEQFSQSVIELCNLSEETPNVTRDFFKKNPILYLNRPTDRVISCVEKDIFDPKIAMNGLVLYFRDITHETEVDRIKSEFLSTAAHEFRTPLSSILGFSELLLTRSYDVATQKRFTEIIHRQSTHLKSLLDELLDLARIDARAGRDFYILVDNPRHVIQQVLDETQALATEKHQLQIEFMEKWPQIAFDNEKLSQVLTNIMSNAYKYSPEGGIITCSTLMKNSRNKQMFGIRIEDQGIGMTPEELNKIGTRFYRADPTGTIPGTGLGLSIVKEIIEIHKGDVEITSYKDQGTTITVWLPVVQGDEQSNSRVV